MKIGVTVQPRKGPDKLRNVFSRKMKFLSMNSIYLYKVKYKYVYRIKTTINIRIFVKQNVQ